MSKKSLISAIALALLFAATPSRSAEEAPEGYILVEQDVLLLFIDEPDDSFISAIIEFEAGDLEATAHDIRRAAAVMRIEGKTLNNEGSDLRIREAAVRLENLARRIEDEEIDDVSQLDAAFAHTHHVLGTAYTMEGEKYWEQNAEESTRAAMLKARTRLQNASKWSKTKISAAGKTTFDAISNAGAKGGDVASNAKDWLAALQFEANTLGEVIEDEAK